MSPDRGVKHESKPRCQARVQAEVSSTSPSPGVKHESKLNCEARVLGKVWRMNQSYIICDITIVGIINWGSLYKRIKVVRHGSSSTRMLLYARTARSTFCFSSGQPSSTIFFRTLETETPSQFCLRWRWVSSVTDRISVASVLAISSNDRYFTLLRCAEYTCRLPRLYCPLNNFWLH